MAGFQNGGGAGWESGKSTKMAFGVAAGQLPGLCSAARGQVVFVEDRRPVRQSCLARRIHVRAGVRPASDRNAKSSSENVSSERQTCSQCSGAGTIPCQMCESQGFIYFEEEKLYRTCLLCIGKGAEECPKCNGDGEDIVL